MKRFLALFLLVPAMAVAQVNNPNVKPELTEVWSPVPPKVTPAATIGQPPSDAIVLFDGHDLSNWESVNGGPAEWTVGNGEFVVAPKAGSIQIKPVHPFADAPAKRVLVRAVKTGKAPLRLLAPLVLHDRSGAKHTPEAEAILRGEAAIEWL